MRTHAQDEEWDDQKTFDFGRKFAAIVKDRVGISLTDETVTLTCRFINATQKQRGDLMFYECLVMQMFSHLDEKSKKRIVEEIESLPLPEDK